MIELHTTLGLDQDSGLEGTLREAAHDTEATLVELQDFELLSGLMYLRRHEKDFMMRLKSKYIDKYDARYEDVVSIIKDRRFDEDTKQQLLAWLNQYHRDFGLST